jgi:hypothetical protein
MWYEPCCSCRILPVRLCSKVLSIWEDQFGLSIPNKDLMKDVFPFFQLLWILTKHAGV